MDPSGAESVARAYVEDLAAGRWLAAEARHAPEMKEKLPAAQLEAVWRGIETAAGPFEAIDVIEARPPRDGSCVVATACRFARGRREIRVTVDEAGLVAGLFRGLVDADVAAGARALVEAIARRDGAAWTPHLEERAARVLTPGSSTTCGRR